MSHRFIGIPLGVLVVLGVVGAGTALADGPIAATGEPNAGLVDGQSVRVSWTNAGASQMVYIMECNIGRVPDRPTGLQHCFTMSPSGSTWYVAAPSDASGAGSADFKVIEGTKTNSDVLAGSTVTCTGTCYLSLMTVAGGVDTQASVPIRFAAADTTPASKPLSSRAKDRANTGTSLLPIAVSALIVALLVIVLAWRARHRRPA